MLPLQLQIICTESRPDSSTSKNHRARRGRSHGLAGWFEFPNLWIGASTDSRNPRLNIRGDIQIDVTEASPREIRFLPNWYADCRYHADEDTGMKVQYAIDEILETGVVGKNVCGWFHAKPQPGAIVFYVRHRTLLEMIAL